MSQKRTSNRPQQWRNDHTPRERARLYTRNDDVYYVGARYRMRPVSRERKSAVPKDNAHDGMFAEAAEVTMPINVTVRPIEPAEEARQRQKIIRKQEMYFSAFIWYACSAMRHEHRRRRKMSPRRSPESRRKSHVQRVATI